MLMPVLRFYQIILFPLAKPSALLLDAWLGGEDIRYFQERDLRQVIRLHMNTTDSEIDRVEGQGALNFLELDDVPLAEEGEVVAPDSVLALDFNGLQPVFPEISPDINHPFLNSINSSGKSWVVITDKEGEPRLVLSANDFIREAIFEPDKFNPYHHCHRPIIAREPHTRLGSLIRKFQVRPGNSDEDIIDNDVILLWGEQRRVITGTDILGRLLRGIANPPESVTMLASQTRQISNRRPEITKS